MKVKISTKLLILLLITSILPLIIASYVGYRNNASISNIAAEANQEIANLAMANSMEALAQEKEQALLARTESIARNINEILVRVESDTAELAAYGTYLYDNADSVNRYASPSVYGKGTNGAYGSLEENQNSWLMVSTLGLDENGAISQELMDEIHLTEFLDIKFRSTANNNPYAIQLYLNTKSQITRGMPFIDGNYLWLNATEQFPPDMDLPKFDFYYLADEEHNPERVPTWTQLYWDPAGLGWMVSSIAPIYQTEELQGVVGIDITLSTMIDEIIDFQIEETGFAFLMSNSGQAIAFPKRASEFLGFADSHEGNFGDNEKFSFFLTETNDEAFRDIINEMQVGEHDLTTYTASLEKGKTDYLFAYHPVELSNWSIGIVVPVEEAIAPALLTNEQITQNMDVLSQSIQERSAALAASLTLLSGAIILVLFPVAMLLSRNISNPIKMLEEGAQKIGAGSLAHRISLNTGDELEQLAFTFNQMAADLQHKINEIEAANEELEILDTLKSQFISMASHELRTPLIAIQGYADLIRDGETGAITEEQRGMLNTVSRNTTRLARIVSELLDVSRIEENKLMLRQDMFAIDQVIREIAEEQQPMIRIRQHMLNLDIASNLPLIVGDRDRISQVFINLLSNAIKYTPDGNRIVIKAEAQDTDVVHVIVSDNGVGIQTAHLDKIFSRFYEAGDITQHQTSKSAFMAGGTGLGLAIVKGIVEAHGGEVWVESEVGKGTDFHITLPGKVGVSAPVSRMTQEDVYKTAEFEYETEVELGGNGRITILIIDDEEDAIAVTTKMLEGQYNIQSAHTSATGLKIAISERPDLILLDAWMPGISGYDVCHTLKNNTNTNKIPIIIFTAATQQEEIERAQNAGANGFIAKPFKKNDLLTLIESFRIDS